MGVVRQDARGTGPSSLLADVTWWYQCSSGPAGINRVHETASDDAGLFQGSCDGPPDI